ncbi:amino acid permease domain-containing protein [Ditylenchus destructor]|uniref:Amino acid permease domain-containing protein n=1 Tax=Ditylenchus destructor TaxID=166010 RepID=A0AAD4MZ25_9BILA|nr:amino acid permease domain-containing protein [Ditylenchus destructor]
MDTGSNGPVSNHHHHVAQYKMGFFGATSYVIGNIIGSGIFVTPATIIRYTESVGLSLIIWVACAGIAFLGSLCYIELGTSIREAGCDFAYICYVKWYSIAFSFMWVSVLMTYPATIAIIAETFGQYLLEGLRQSYEIPAHLLPTCQKLFGITLLWLVTWMNFFALGKFAARFQIAATVAKLLACALIILTGFYYYFFKGWNEGLKDPMKNSNTKIGDLMMGLYGGLYAYSGWDILNYGTGEIYRPKRNMPLALLTGILTVSLVYFAMNIAYFAVLDVETMKSSNAVAALFSQKTLGGFSATIPFLIGILLVGSLNSNLFSGSRYMYAAAKQGHLPACFSCVNILTESPRVAIFAQSALAIGISFVGDLDALIGYVCEKFDKLDAIRIPIVCIYAFLAINIGLVIIPIVQDFAITSLGICICIVGFGFYFLFVYPSSTPNILTYLNHVTTVFASILFNALPDLKSRSSFSVISNDSVPDLHSDEKNTLIRNGSTSGLRMW